jgi:hypothetical protein
MIEVTIKVNSATLRKLQKYIDRNNNELSEGETPWTIETAVTVLTLIQLEEELKSI